MEKRRIISILLAAVMFLTSCIAPVQLFAAEESVLTGFITRSGDKLMNGEQEFRFISSNVPTLLMVEDVYWHVPDPWEQEDAIKTVKQMGGEVIRTYVLSVKKSSDTLEVRHVEGPGEFNEAAFLAMDKALQLANQYGIRLIIPFVDEYSWQGGTADYAAFRKKTKAAFYTDEQIKADFKATINYVLNRVNTYTGVAYKDDPAILAWETGNELVPPSHAWTAEMAAYIKSIDSNHLVIDGKYGIDTASLDDPNIDIVSNHYYPDHYPNYADQCSTDRLASQGKKPYIIGEFGFVQPDTIEELLDIVVENGTAGAFIWSLRFHNKEGGFYPHTEGVRSGVFYSAYRWPGFPSGDTYFEAETLSLLREKAYEIQGIDAPAIEEPATPVLLPINSVSAITWKGSAGAEGYDVLRASSAEGPWEVIASDFSFTLAEPQYFNDTRAVSGETYYYAVKAKNSGGESDMSNVVGPVVANHAIIDNINGGAYYVEWGKFYDYSTDLKYDGTAIDDYHGDYFRLKQLSTATQQYVSYALPQAGEGHVVTPDVFTVETYFDPGKEADFTIQVSSNDALYIDLTPDIETIEGEKTKVIYTGTLPADTKYVNILFPDESTAQLGKVVLEYITDGAALTFPQPKKGQLVSDGKIIDEMNNTLKIHAHEGDLGFETGDDYGYFDGDLKRLIKSNVGTLTSFTYKAGGDMNYFKMTTFVRQDNGEYIAPNFKIYASEDESGFSEIEDISYSRVASPKGGWWNRDQYIIYSLPEGTRYLKVEFPDLTGSLGTWVAQVSVVEIGVGSVTIERPPTDRKTDIIDNFDGYSGSNNQLREACTFNEWGSAGSITLDPEHKNGGTYGLKFVADLDTKGPHDGTGFAGYDLAIDNADWSGKSGIQFWLDPNGQTMPIEFQFQEASSNEQWKCTLNLTGSEEAGIFKLPFSSFWRNDGVWNKNPSDPKYNGALDLDVINTFGIYTSGHGSHTIYFDSIGLYYDNAIDTFENYGGDNAGLQSVWTINSSGDNVTAALDSSNKNDGSYGLKYEYTVGSKGFCGLEKNTSHADWTGTNGIQLWLKPDGSNRNLSVQFKEASGDYWKAQLALSGTEGRWVDIPFSSFSRPDWQGGSGTIELNDIIEFGFYVDGAQGTGAIYFDSIKPVKLTSIDNFEFYNGSQSKLQSSWTVHGDGCPITAALDETHKSDGAFALKYDYDLTSIGWGGLMKALPKMNWTGKNAISLWTKGDGSSRSVSIQFKENSGEYWKASFDVTGTEGQIVSIPLASFATPDWSSGNDILELDEIIEIAVYIDRGASGAGTGTLYIDALKLTDIPVIDDFDYYDGGELTAKKVYVPNEWGNTVTLTPDTVNKNAGKYGVNYQYALSAERNFAGVTKQLNGMSWVGSNGIQFWYKPDGSNNKLVLQFKEPNQETFETYITLSGTEAETVFIPFTDFHYPPWYSGGAGANGVIDLEAIAEFSIYVNLVDGGTEGTHNLYFDSIELVNRVIDPEEPEEPTDPEEPDDSDEDDDRNTNTLPSAVKSSTGAASVHPQAGGTVSLGTKAGILIPAGALSGSSRQNVTIKTLDKTAAPSGFKVLGQTYTFNVGSQESYKFNKPVTLTFEFDPSALEEGEVPSVFYYDNTLGRWVRLGGTVQNNTIKVEVDHFTDFAVFSTKLHAFPDLIPMHWGYNEIRELDALGVTSGYTNGNFGPDDYITRAEFSTLIAKALQLPSYLPEIPTFLDVKPADWFFKFVEPAYKRGLIKGSNGIFNPTGYITREQLLVILMNGLGNIPADLTGKTSFDDDVKISSWARPYVEAAQREGLTNFNSDDNLLHPQNKVTRAEACKLIVDFMKKQK